MLPFLDKKNSIGSISAPPDVVKAFGSSTKEDDDEPIEYALISYLVKQLVEKIVEEKINEILGESEDEHEQFGS